ncbi:unnamed protein product [Adineta steineri]|nr:unnamed protein product [Adineta steineri]CAF1006242.1 unnamed protein product [Adineta steineri]CAF3618731.1 unnamed protein product [Adineta steineri]
MQGVLSTDTSNDDDNTEYSLDQLAANVPSTNFYPFKSLSNSRKRFKRPSWATVGKRSSISLKKRPSWAQVG